MSWQRALVRIVVCLIENTSEQFLGPLAPCPEGISDQANDYPGRSSNRQESMEEQLTENDFSGIHAEPFEIQHHDAQHQQGELRHPCWFGMNLAPRFADMQAQLKRFTAAAIQGNTQTS